MANITGFGKLYQHFSNLFAKWDDSFIEPIRDTLWNTPSHEVCRLEKYSLFHYDVIPTAADSTDSILATSSIKTPLLIVYRLINRQHYILDLLPQ